MNFKLLPLLALLLVLFVHPAGAESVVYVPSDATPPAPAREFRAAWIATVANIDWPSKPGLSIFQQRAELINILDTAARLNLNAVIFQVRPAADAMYTSRIEPWSPYLTGVMGRPPNPWYDPLAFAVAEAHKRGLELHAWFNPYRAAHPKGNFPLSRNHISKTHPGYVKKYGDYLWLDPGEKDVQDYSLRVVMDVVNRYDIDGVHFDDYFYPYKVKNARKQDVDFPDGPSWKKYGVATGLSREDWRRENVNTFIHRVHDSIKAAKPWVKFGVSPFGIWRPGNPPQIKGMDAYEGLYCDSRKWLANGWLDYCAPQLYWSISAPEQSYPVLLKWWLEQNPRQRHIWPGINTGKVGGRPEPDERAFTPWKPEEIVNQIRIARGQSSDHGNIHWSVKSLQQNRGGIATALQKEYAEPALVPASPWLAGTNTLAKPAISATVGSKVKWEATGTEKPALWVLQTKVNGAWTATILPGDIHSHKLANTPDLIAVTGIDRIGLASPPAVVQRTVESDVSTR